MTTFCNYSKGKILFHNIYKEILLIFRSKKLNIGKVFLSIFYQIKPIQGDCLIFENTLWHVFGRYSVSGKLTNSFVD